MSVQGDWEAAYSDRDPEDLAHLAAGNARQPRKRVSADALIRDDAGKILIVDPTYKPDWDLPGGMAEANEAPKAALARELREELGLDRTVGELLCVDWVTPHGPWDDLLAFVFDGGVLTGEQAADLHVVDPELAAARFVEPNDAARLLRPYVWRRVAVALDTLAGGTAAYLQNGER